MTTLAEPITLVKHAIHNASEPRHFMRITQVSGTVVASHAGVELAHSGRALKLKEVGYDIYDPVYYFPRSDVDMSVLKRNDRTTHCPLKGHTEYFDLHTSSGRRIENMAWSYVDVIPEARAIEDLIAFDTRAISVLELPQGE